jgi:hypothetical protein
LAAGPAAHCFWQEVALSFAIMSTWIIVSWVVVAILTAINIVVFIKLKQASDQMMKMAFPGAKNMNEALAQMQKMMGGMPRGGGQRGGGRPAFPGGGNMDAQLKQAMDMLQQMNKKKR